MAKEKLTPTEIVAFCTQMSMILKSGISMSEGVGIMYDDASNPAGKDILRDIHKEIEIGMPLHVALGTTNKFPDYVVTMVEIGEASGRLDNVMESLTAYYEREENVSRVIRSAVTYPLVMITMMTAVIALLVVRVMPIFNDVFQGLGAQMTGFSLAVMNFGQALGTYGAFIIIIVFAFIVLFLIFRQTTLGKKAIEVIKEKSFLTRNIYAKIASGRFASAMSLMLASGMDTDKSLDMVGRLLKTSSLRHKIIICKRKLEKGTSLSDALQQVGIFSGVYAKMVSVAFKTGAMDTVMEKLAKRYEEETNTQINNIISIVEPSLVAVLSVIIGIILLSVMLPLMGIMSAIG